MSKQKQEQEQQQPAAIYVRRSSAASNEKSCADQRAACRDAMSKLGYYVEGEAAIMEDDISSGLLFRKRKQLGALLSLLSASRPLNPRPYHAIFIDDVSRIARNFAFVVLFVQALRFHKIKLFDSQGNEYTSIQGYCMLLTMAMAAELERHFLSTRTRRGIRAAYRKGHVPAKVYGFRRTDPREQGA